MPLRARPLAVLAAAVAVTIAALCTTAVAPVMSNTTYHYDAASHVLTLRLGTGVTGQIEVSDAHGQYLVSASGGMGAPWTDTGDAMPAGAALAYNDGAGSEVLTIQAAHDGVSGVVLSRIDLADTSGPVSWLVKAGSGDPYRDPMRVIPGNALSTVRLFDARPIDFGTTDLEVDAPSVMIDQDISAARSIDIASRDDIALGKATVRLTASDFVQTTGIAGNGKNLDVHGSWWALPRTGGTSAISGAADVSVSGDLHPRGDISASGTALVLGALSVPSGVTPTITAPVMIVGGAVQAEARACGGGAEVQACGVHASGPVAGITIASPVVTLAGGVTLSGAVNVTQDAITGRTDLRGGLDQPGGTFSVGGTLEVSGAPTMTLRTSALLTGGGLLARGSQCVASDALCVADVHLATPLIPTRDVTVDAGIWSTAFTSYVPGSLTVTGPVAVAPPVAPQLSNSASLLSDGPLDLRGGAQVPANGSMTVQGAPTTLAGATAPVAAGAVGAADAACDPGPLLAIGDLRVTQPIRCLSTLLASSGTTWIAADVTTQAHQAYTGPVTVAAGDGPIRLRAGGAGIAFHQGVAAAWSRASGAIAGYRATAGASSCATDAATFQCALVPVPEGSDITFAVDPITATIDIPASGRAGTDGPLPSGRTSRRTVARGSRTPLTRLIVPPASRGTRRWAERGPCSIRSGRLVAPRRAGSCTLTLAVAKTGRTKAWHGRAIIDVR